MIKIEQYQELASTLWKTLAPEKAKFYDNIARLSTVLGLVEKWSSDNSRIVDLACGAFVLDFLLENRGKNKIIAVDKDPHLEKLYQELKDKNILRHTLFYRRNITDFVTTEKHWANLVILNDALFYGEHSLPELMPRIRDSLADEGHFIFDIWSLEFYQRFRPLYDLVFPQYQDYRSYTISQVNTILKQNGFEVKATVPYFSPCSAGDF